MSKTRYVPWLETLEALALPSAAPLLPIIGPFAPGSYPQDPPPAPGHHQERPPRLVTWNDRVEARAEHAADLLNAPAPVPEGQDKSLRDALTALRDRLAADARRDQAHADRLFQRSRATQHASSAALLASISQWWAGKAAQAQSCADALTDVLRFSDDFLEPAARVARAVWGADGTGYYRTAQDDRARMNDPRTGGEQYRVISQHYNWYAGREITCGWAYTQLGRILNR